LTALSKSVTRFFTNGPMNEGIQKSVKWTSQNEKYEINSNTENTFTDQAVV